MEFTKVTTYGKYRHRVIKTDLWISPLVKRNRLFDSTSSESSINSSEDRSKRDFAGHEKANGSSSRVNEKCSNNYDIGNLSKQSSCNNNYTSPVVVKHSTPFSSHVVTKKIPRRLPVISPPGVSELPLNPKADVYSPSLFSDATQSDSSANQDNAGDDTDNRNKDAKYCSTANHGRAGCNTTSSNKNSCGLANHGEAMHDSFNENEDRHSTANHSDAVCNLTNQNDNGDSCDIDWTNELNEDASFKNETSSSLELEIKLQKLSSDDIQNISDTMKHLLSLNESPSSAIKVSHESMCLQNTNTISSICAEDSLKGAENLSTEDSNCQNTCNKRDHSNTKEMKNFTNVTFRKKVVHHNKTLLEKLNLSHDSLNSSEQKCTDNVPNNDFHSEETSNITNPVQPTSIEAISKGFKQLCLLDAKVYLDKRDALKARGSSTAINKSNQQVPTNSFNSLKDRPPSVLHPTSPQQIHTPTDQCIGKFVNNPNFSSFVEALTPARFQQNKRSLSPKEKILVQCEQKNELKFTDALLTNLLERCEKVGEGTYGEVYKANDGVEDVALKVIPVEGNFLVNGELQKSFEDMIPEIVISKELSGLDHHYDTENTGYVCSNFIKVKRVMLVQDSYPEKLLYEWDRWKRNHNCENERPDMFPSDQYFVVFMFLNGGEDLERFQFTSMEEALSVLQQVTVSLAVAEQSLMFEHRDLHWGNVLIKKTKCETIRYKLCGDEIHVKSDGVFVSIIDFTLSRLTKDGMTVFCDLSKDPDIFEGKGDYQFQVYRLMKKANKNDWASYKPYSNVLWIRYLIDKILNIKKYKTPNNSTQRNLRNYLRQLLSYESATQTVKDGFLGIHIST